MLIITATMVRRAKRINSDIQIIHALSDDPADWSPGDELADTVFVTVMTDVVPTVLVEVAITKEVK